MHGIAIITSCDNLKSEDTVQMSDLHEDQDGAEGLKREDILNGESRQLREMPPSLIDSYLKK